MTLAVQFSQPSPASAPTLTISRNPTRALLMRFSARAPGVVTVCRCGEFRHRSYRKLAQCAFPKSGASGEGRYAIVMRCYSRGSSQIVCLDDLEVAERALRDLVARGCRTRCQQRHQLVRLALEADDV